ncbi:hypothetical protein [Brevundimonas sp. Root1279]|uniref:hypothetical protein n=1 Tax=Brevundimonas sp. Root1279 TaxID=1736443 RepID=UPI0006F379B0|nr:hypothetical protein [Brevundimonas sp. Root1279]KQW80906.1 hypothetical protein ASC65_13135 [Brevundimonas sp. Root1279]
MAPTLIVLALLALGVVIVVWATRGKKSLPTTHVSQEADTAWNDPITPGQPARPIHPAEEPAAHAPPAGEPRH